MTVRRMYIYVYIYILIFCLLLLSFPCLPTTLLLPFLVISSSVYFLSCFSFFSFYHVYIYIYMAFSTYVTTYLLLPPWHGFSHANNLGFL